MRRFIPFEAVLIGGASGMLGGALGFPAISWSQAGILALGLGAYILGRIDR